MGHCSDILVVNKKSDIMPAAQEFAWNHADYEECYGEYHGFVKIEDKEFESYEEAEEYLRQFQGSYDDRAVKFKDWELKNKTQQQSNLENKVQEIERDVYSLNRPTQKTMTCPHCGKRVETTWRYFCPTCRENITPKTKKAKIEVLEEKLTKFNNKIQELQLKRRKKKFTVKWAMKVEVHC